MKGYGAASDWGCKNDRGEPVVPMAQQRIRALRGVAMAETPDSPRTPEVDESLQIEPLSKLLAELRRKAPNARILVAGYPELFGDPDQDSAKVR
jgi:hypothetical protein